MLCVRSASLTMITRMSRTIASSILRKLSACASLRLLNWIWSSLVTPSTISATSLPNFCSTSAIEEGVSSTTSCRIAACSVAPSRCRSARMSATATGWVMNASPRAALLALVCGFGVVEGLAHPLDLVGREVTFDLAGELRDPGSASSARQQTEDGRRVVHRAGALAVSPPGRAAGRGSRRRGRAGSQESVPAPARDPARRASRR